MSNTSLKTSLLVYHIQTHKYNPGEEGYNSQDRMEPESDHRGHNLSCMGQAIRGHTCISPGIDTRLAMYIFPLGEVVES